MNKENSPNSGVGRRSLPDMVPTTGRIELPNGCSLYWKENEVGGRTYSSDEIGGGVHVWDTALVDSSTLLAAMTEENRLLVLEAHINHHKEQEAKRGTE